MTDMKKLHWFGADRGFAQAAGWYYAIQSEQVRGEPVFHSLLVKPPGTFNYLHPANVNIQPPVPDIGLRGEGTKAYVRREAQAHADLVAKL